MRFMNNGSLSGLSVLYPVWIACFGFFVMCASAFLQLGYIRTVKGGATTR